MNSARGENVCNTMSQLFTFFVVHPSPPFPLSLGAAGEGRGAADGARAGGGAAVVAKAAGPRGGARWEPGAPGSAACLRDRRARHCTVLQRAGVRRALAWCVRRGGAAAEAARRQRRSGAMLRASAVCARVLCARLRLFAARAHALAPVSAPAPADERCVPRHLHAMWNLQRLQPWRRERRRTRPRPWSSS